MPNSSRSLKVLSLAAMGATALKLTPKRRVRQEPQCTVETSTIEAKMQNLNQRCEKLGQGGFGAVYSCDPATVTKIPINAEAYAESLHERDMNAKVQTKWEKTQQQWPVAKMTACTTIKDAQGNELALTTFEKGATLDDDKVRAWDNAKKLKYFKEMAKNLDTLHGMGIVHRDVKIENSVLGKDKRALLIDLGLALDLDGHRTIKPEHVEGTHFSRNVCKRYTVSPASDFYSLGVEMSHIFFEDLYDESVKKYEAQENSFFSSEHWRFIEDEVSAKLESRELYENSFDDLLRDLVTDMLRGDGQTWYDPPASFNAQHWSDWWNGVESQVLEKEFANRIQRIIDVSPKN